MAALGSRGDTIFHISTYGQSLSLGNQGCPALSITQPYSNLMLSSNPTGTLTALVENVLNGSSTNPPCVPSDKQESPASGLGNTFTFLSSGQTQVVAVTRSGVGGTAYQGLKKGTTPYNNLLTAVTTVKTDAVGAGRSYRQIGVMFTHGETDWQVNTTSGTTYKADLTQLQSDLQADVNVTATQSGTVILFLDQMSSWGAVNPSGNPCFVGDGSFTCATYSDAGLGVPIAQWEYFRDNPATSCLVGPKYQFDYATQDNIHLINTSYLSLGELQAKYIKKVVLDGMPCMPLAPRSITLNGATITCRFWVPSGSLALDTTLVAARTNSGFYYRDDAASASILSIALASSDTVTITLSATPSGANPHLGYAFKEGSRFVGSGASVALANGGNLRDTDSTVGQSGGHLYDWAIAFYEPIGFSWNPYNSGASLSGPATFSGPSVH